MSPLGTRLVFLLFLICAGFAGGVPLASHLLPRGDELVYVSSRQDRPIIYRMDVNHRLEAPLTDGEFGDYSPTWSPDGNWIAFHSSRDREHDIYIMDALGRNVHRLTDNNGLNEGPAWSPDGQHIAFYSDFANEYNIYVMNIGCVGRFTECSKPLLFHDSYWNAYPAWSPDGKQIAFQSNQEGDNTNIYVINTDGTNRRRLTDNIGEDYSPAWSPDGKHIIYVSQDIRKRGSITVYVMDAKGGDPHQVIGGVVDLNPSWSADGKHIVFASNSSGNFEIYMADGDGSNPQRLTFNSADDIAPKWRP